MTTFDPYAWEDFFFGQMDREEAEKILTTQPMGSFLLRESNSHPGGYSLSVRECDDGDHPFYHYFIEQKETEEGGTSYQMSGGPIFVNIPLLLTHYQIHVLKKGILVRPVPKQAICRVICRFKFDGERVTDLPFERGEILEVLGKPEEKWWKARNTLKITGLIPVNYVKLYEEGDEISLQNPSTNSSSGGSNSCGDKRFSTQSTASERSDPNKRISVPEFDTSKTKSPQVPAWVRVVAERYPSIYDLDALTLKKDKLIYLMEVLPTGMCKGMTEIGGKIGLFPFSYVEFTDIPLNEGPFTPNSSCAF